MDLIFEFKEDKDNDLAVFDDSPQELFNGWVYHPNPDHRGIKNKKDKSKWNITINEEGYCFVSARRQNWIDGQDGWGLHLENNTPKEVGTLADSSQQKNRTSWIARFKDGTGTNNWHGWPADTKLKTDDRPSERVLEDWIKKKYINKCKRRKINRGQL